ncbi:MAG: hypothetical protein ACTHN3_07370 [Solirubrobacterales bacterium]
MRKRPYTRLAAGALACAALALCSAPVPAATAAGYDPIASGATTITLSPAFTRVLAAHGVTIEARGGARRQGAKFTLPASGGEFDPIVGAGSVKGAGELVFAAGRRKLPFRSLVFKAQPAPLYAKVGGGQLKVATARRVAFARRGFGGHFGAFGLRLTPKVASRLDKKLRLGRAISAGLEIGTLAVSVTPATVHLEPGGRVRLAIASGFAAKLNGLFVSLNPIAPAELGPGDTLSFPIAPESILAPGGGAGTVKTSGAVELLQLGSAQLFWREQWLEATAASISSEPDLEPSPPRAGKQPRAPLLSLSSEGRVVSDPSSRTIEISGCSALLTAATAETLNSSFAEGRAVFVAGEEVGSLSLGGTGE